MENRAAALSGIGQKILIGDHVRSRLKLCCNQRLQRLAPGEFSREFQAIDHALPIGVGREVIGLDRRVLIRIPRLD